MNFQQLQRATGDDGPWPMAPRFRSDCGGSLIDQDMVNKAVWSMEREAWGPEHGARGMECNNGVVAPKADAGDRSR
ncbi:hypothetical protein E5D57_002110 [Metarhizium anisopliae]|nr:hypothetical protein E5D57_002110 [Metarhizium anisopliae]